VQIRQTVLREGLLVALLGLAVGVTAAAALGNALSSLQYGVTVADPVSWAIVPGLLTGTVAAA
jgi:hypothetical protein